MTRKDYERIAAVIREAVPASIIAHDFRQGCKWTQETVANRMADMLAEDNPRFNRTRFLEACGL